MENRKTTPPLSGSLLLLCALAAFTVAAVLGLQMVVLSKQWNKEASVQNNIQNPQTIVNNSILDATSKKRVFLRKNLRPSVTCTESSFLNTTEDKKVTEARECLRGLVVSTLGVDGWTGHHESPGLGAVFLHVVSAWAVAHFHDVKAVVPQRTIQRLKDVFIGVNKLVEPLEEVVQLRRESGKFPCHGMDETKAKWARPLDDWEGYGLKLLTEGPLTLRSGSVYPAYIAPLVPVLKKTLKIRKWFRTWADSRLHEIRSSLTRFSPEEEPWSFVAVHAHQPRSVGGLFSEDRDLSISFYPHAVAWLRAQLWRELKGKRVLLAVISFNDKWATEKLIPLLRESMHASEAVSVQWTGAMTEKSDREAEMMDLALLILCDHAVAAYGDLPTAAALLSEGLFTFWALGPSNVTTAFSWLLPDWKMLY